MPIRRNAAIRVCGMRHAPFAIGLAERDAWMKHMKAALEKENFSPELHALFMDYFERTATFMMNE